MPVTPTYGLPYPALTDAPDVPADMKALAEGVESTVSTTDGNVAALDSRLDTAEADINTLQTDTAFGPWQNMALVNGWVARSAHYVPGYREIPGDRVELTGTAISGTITNGTVVANLPVGYRPGATTYLPLLANNGETIVLVVGTTGDLSLQHTTTSFSAISFASEFPLVR
jgi:hypothetical protein